MTKPHAHLYKTARWKARRADQLRRNPLCRMCLDSGMTRAATIADHKTPHRGDEALFFDGPLQSLCKPHHDGSKQKQEARGYSNEIALDGWPVDRKHPANTGRIA